MKGIIRKIGHKIKIKSAPDFKTKTGTKIINKDIFQNTSRISIELSNLCNYARVHKKCPLSLVEEPIILPSRIVLDVINTLKRYGFQGTIGFHTYNEPLMDPRLMKFVELVRQACPGSDIFICTNGYYLDQDLGNDLVESGVSNIKVSAYSNYEFKRLSKIRLKVPYSVELMTLDNRLNFYNSPVKLTKDPCFAPLNEIIVGREGRISLCCLDWRRAYSIGDLHQQTFEEVLLSGELQAVYERLKIGDRFLPLCQRCGWSR